MDIQDAVVSLLIGSNVNTLTNGVIRPLTAATLDVRPILTYSVSATEFFNTFSGSASWRKATFQLDTFADGYQTAQTIVEAATTLLHNYVGTIEDIQIGIMKHLDDTDASEPPDIGQENSIIRIQSSYSILYRCLD